MSTHLTASITWAEKAPNQRELFCLDFIASFLEKIKVVKESCKWITQCEYIDAVLCILKVHSNFLTISKSQPPLKQLPKCIQENPCQSVVKLFQWILKIEEFIVIWRDKLKKGNVNYDEIMLYREHLQLMQKMAAHLKVEGLVFQDQHVKEMKIKYEHDYKELNSLLLKPVPGDVHGKT